MPGFGAKAAPGSTEVSTSVAAAVSQNNARPSQRFVVCSNGRRTEWGYESILSVGSRSAGRGIDWTAGIPLLLLITSGCSHGDSLAPDTRKPPYIAIVAKAGPEVLGEPGVKYTYHIKGLSTGSTYDSTLTVAPADTVIVSVEPGTYSISLVDLPVKCVSRYGLDQEIVVPPGTNTAIARYFITCNVPLAVRVYTAGLPTDPEFIWQVEDQSGSFHETGVIRNRDETLTFESLQPGSYTVSLWNAPEICVFTNNGGRHQTVTVPPDGNVRLGFSVICSKPANRPEILEFSWQYHDSVVVFIAKAKDPDYNLSTLFFDLTDCNGNTVLPDGARERGGMQGGRTSFTLTPILFSAFELGLSDQEIAGHCASLRVQDTDGNTSAVVEALPSFPNGSPPEAVGFNSVLVSNELLTTKLSARDSDGDFFGTFVAARLRDGVLSPRDGKFDIGVFNAAGYEGTTIPDLPLTGRILYTDVYAIMVYVVDLHGNFRKYVDDDPFK